MGAITNDAVATIAAAGSLSAAIYLGAKILVAVQMPATTWTAAALSFQGSVDGVTYNDVYDSQGVEYSVAVSASKYFTIDTDSFARGMLYLKLRSGLTAAPVTQAAGALIKVLTRRP